MSLVIKMLIVFKEIPHRVALYWKEYRIVRLYIEHSPYCFGPDRVLCVLKMESFLIEFQIGMLELSMFFSSSRGLS